LVGESRIDVVYAAGMAVIPGKHPPDKPGGDG
jgi:hypothetical protein